MNCANCGAALPARSDICQHCKTRNDTDLRRFDVVPGPRGGRHCPRCEIELETITIALGGALHVERCERCLGLFFDRHELEQLLDDAVEPAREVDYQRLLRLAEEGRRPQHPPGYLPCPVCRELMHRRAYGRRSGVVVDTCKAHGVWLDGGELGELLRWARLGGLAASGGAVDLGWDDVPVAKLLVAEEEEQAAGDLLGFLRRLFQAC